MVPEAGIDVYFQDREASGVRVVCLCGSTRFMDAFRAANLRLTLEGKIVLSVGCNTKSDASMSLGEDVKKRLDELHLRKIDLADEVLVLNVGGYIGESTRREIEYAKRLGKPISFLEPISQ
jgi:cell division protein FtsB